MSEIIIRDISHWQLIADYAAFAASADGFILKCYDPELAGTGEDPAHDEHAEGLKAKPLADYSYFDPGADGFSQARGFSAHALPVSESFMDVLDLEETEGHSNQTVTNRAIDFINEATRIRGRKPWLYTNFNFLKNIITEPNKIVPKIGGLWVSYPVPSLTKEQIMSIFGSWATRWPPELFRLWQRSFWSRPPGTSPPNNPVDENLWIAPVNEWHNLIDGQTPPAEYYIEAQVPAGTQVNIVEV